MDIHPSSQRLGVLSLLSSHTRVSAALRRGCPRTVAAPSPSAPGLPRAGRQSAPFCERSPGHLLRSRRAAAPVPARSHLGGQCPSREGSLMEAFQVPRRELSRGKGVPTSVLSRPHGTSDLVQFSPLVLQKRSPRAREVKAAPAGDRTGHPGPPAPCSQEEASLGLACLLSTPYLQPQEHPRDQARESWPWPPREGGVQRSFPRTVAN